MIVEAETRVMHIEAKECQRLLATSEPKRMISIFLNLPRLDCSYSFHCEKSDLDLIKCDFLLCQNIFMFCYVTLIILIILRLPFIILYYSIFQGHLVFNLFY